MFPAAMRFRRGWSEVWYRIMSSCHEQIYLMAEPMGAGWRFMSFSSPIMGAVQKHRPLLALPP